jgi:small GTP-binding protein
MTSHGAPAPQGRELAPPRQYDHLLKLVIIGDSGVGKSALLLRFSDNTFVSEFISTIGVDFRFRTVAVGEQRVKLQIWDTAGQERFKTITSAYYRGADGIVVVYDVTRRDSFEHVRQWYTEAVLFSRPADPISVLIVGNKSDRADAVVTPEEGAALAAELGAAHLLTSARTADNVDAAFVNVARDCVLRRRAAATCTCGRGVDGHAHAAEPAAGDKPCCAVM